MLLLKYNLNTIPSHLALTKCDFQKENYKLYYKSAGGIGRLSEFNIFTFDKWPRHAFPCTWYIDTRWYILPRHDPESDKGNRDL